MMRKWISGAISTFRFVCLTSSSLCMTTFCHDLTSFLFKFRILKYFRLDLAASSKLREESTNRVRYFRGRVSNFNQSEARKQCFLASHWSKYETLPRKFSARSGIKAEKET